MKKQYDFIVVGAGFFGAVFTQQAIEAGKSVLVLERRDHIGGNCHSYQYPDTNIIVHQYGTHIFHTNNPTIWKYINRFTEFNRYQHRVLTTHQDRVYAMPINLGTINQFYGLNLKPHEVEAFIASKREGAASNARNLEERAISLVGRDLYEAFIKGYTIKQWGCDPRRLPAGIITRLPVRHTFHDAYFNDRYQGIPIEGYTPIFERMLEGADIELGVDFFEDRERWQSRCKKLLYTGPVDRYFENRFGTLNWRSVRLDIEQLPIEDFQGTSVMNYADEEVPFTRIHEFKHLHLERTYKPSNTTIIVREYSKDDPEEPYYPVNFDEDGALYARYRELQAGESRVLFGGRLAEYKYYDMHQVIAAGLKCARDELG